MDYYNTKYISRFLGEIAWIKSCWSVYQITDLFAGWYMNHTKAALCDVCPSRYYCVNKNRPDPCPTGRWCPGNTGYDQQLCPQGTYGPTTMLASAAECTQCDGGYYCSETGASNMTGPCAPGYYCQTGVNTAAPSNNNTGFGGKCF